MKVGVRVKLFLVSLLLMLFIGLIIGIYLENAQRAWAESRIESELLHHAKLVREGLLLADRANTISIVEPLADRFGQTIDQRVTIIADDGRVLGDSDLDEDQVRRIENHGSRAEVVTAKAEGIGVARRYSTTIGTDMLYVAIPFQRDDGNGVVRVEVSLQQVESTILELRTFLIFAGLLAGLAVLAVAVVIAFASSHLLTRILRNLLEHARKIAPGVLGKNLQDSSMDEISSLGAAFNQITLELDRTAKTMAKERYRFEAVLEGMSEAVFALGERQQITLVNQAAYTMLGLTDSPLGRLLGQVIPVREVVDLTRTMDFEKSASVQFDLPGSEQRRVLARAQGTGQGCIVVIHDITEIYRLEEMRRQFVANVSHELRTPVSVIQGYAETLLDGALEDKAVGRSMLESLMRNAVRLTSVIEDLLDLSRLDSHCYQLAPEEVAVLDVVEELRETVAPVVDRKGLRLELDIDPNLKVWADASALSHALRNFLDNAVKYTPDKGRVAVRAQHSDGLVRIEVQDDGAGIEACHRPRLFERFYRVDTGRSRDVGGTGLGLAIVKNLVEAMAGHVGMEPVKPNGSIFWMGLPGVPATPMQTVPKALDTDS
ncbi:MAG: ATP-binding protein [Candidatus Sedimenticola sp. (ex Thyasira tokunagai)]